MREILFRGKAVNRNENFTYRTDYKNGDWVYGLLADVNDYAGFSKMTNTDGITGIEVDTNTIGQYTGLTDKSGKRIFEGDIVGCYSNYRKKYNIGVVKYGNFNCSCCGGVYGWVFENEDIREHSSYEVLGNIYDNPELLEVQK